MIQSFRVVMIVCVVLTNACLLSQRAAAMCEELPCHVIEGRIVGCEKPRVPQSAVSDWMKVHPEDSAAAIDSDLVNSGIVLTVDVLEERKCEAVKFEPAVAGGTPKRYFVWGETCNELSPGSKIEKVVEPYCCDTFPAHSVPCILGLEAMKRWRANRARTLLTTLVPCYRRLSDRPPEVTCENLR